MERFELRLKNQFFINRFNKYKFMAYQDLKFNQKHKSYEFYNRYEKIKLGVQLCDFLNTDFSDLNSIREFINKYGITIITHLSDIKIYQYYSEKEYNEMIDDVINNLKNKLEMYKNAFIADITYIYNLNDLEELNDLTPIQRLHILRDSKKESEVRKLYDSNNLKLTLNNFGDFTEFSITREADAQEIAKNVNTDYLNTYCFESNDIIQTFIIELFEMTEIESTAIKKCKNCGKYFLTTNSAVIYCDNVFADNKTCREIGASKVFTKNLEKDEAYNLYRKVYKKKQALAKSKGGTFEIEYNLFKNQGKDKKNAYKLKEISKEEFMKCLNKQ